MDGMKKKKMPKKMMGGGMMYKDGGDVEVVEQGGKGYKKTVKFK